MDTASKNNPVARVRDQIFISYSHRDAEWLQKLRDILTPLVRNGSIRLWSDLDIQAGQNWQQEIDEALVATKVAVLLVTHHFLASRFIVEYEIPILLAAERLKLVKIVWIAVGASLWEETELRYKQAANDPNRPLNTLPDSTALQELVKAAQIIKTIFSK